MRARFYNPIIGRFTQEDVYRGDGLNLYAYCGNNPVRYWDPSGFLCESKINQYNKEVREFDGNRGEYLRNKYWDKVESSGLEHSSKGEFTYDPRTGNVSKMKGGGHGQANIDFLEEIGLEYEIVSTYPNGVRIGNVKDHKTKLKRTGTNQAWFPEGWSDQDIVNSGESVGNLSANKNAADGIASFGNVNGVRVGVIRTDGKIATVFPDATKQP